MKRLIIGLIALLSFVQAFSQGNDSTKYVYYRYTYGNRLARYWADTVLQVPNDTIWSKDGIAIKGGIFYIGNHVKWTQVTGSGGTTDTLAFATWQRLYKTIDSMKIVNDARYRTPTDTSYAHLLMTRLWGYKIADSLGALISGSGGSPNTSIGGQVAVAITGTNNVKSLKAGFGEKIDSNSNTVTISRDTTVKPIQWAAETSGRTIYNKTSWSNTMDFTQHGAATLAVDNGFLDLAGSNSGSGLDFVTFSNPTTGRYWTMTVTWLIKDNSANIFGLGIGLNSINLSSNLDIQAQFTTPSSTSQTLMWRNQFFAQLGTTGTGPTTTQGDVVEAVVKFADSVINISYRNITSGSSIFTNQFVYTAPSGLAAPNTSLFAIYSMAGIQQLQRIKVTQDDVFNANLLAQADSKTEFFADNWAFTVPHKLQNTYPSTVTYGGSTDQLEHMIAASKDVLLHNPIQILEYGGSNNKRAGQSDLQVETLFDSLYRIYTAAGIIVYPTILPEDSTGSSPGVGMTNIKNWMAAKYPNYINLWDTLSTANVLKSAFQHDKVHPNQDGINAIVAKIITTGQIKNFTYRSHQIRAYDQNVVALSGDSIWLTRPFVTSVYRKVGVDSTYFTFSDGSTMMVVDSLGAGSAPATLSGSLTSGKVPVASGAHALSDGIASDNGTTFTVTGSQTTTHQVNLATDGSENVVIGGTGGGAYELDVTAGGASAFGANGFINAYGSSAAFGIFNRNTNTRYVSFFSDPILHWLDNIHSENLLNIDTFSGAHNWYLPSAASFNIASGSAGLGVLNVNGNSYVTGIENTTGPSAAFSLHRRDNSVQALGIFSTAGEVNFFFNAQTGNIMTFNTDGSITLPTYGLGSNTGTAAFNLAVTSAGKIIEVTPGGGSPPFDANTAILKDHADATKTLKFDISAFSTATARTITVPNTSLTIAGINIAQTWAGAQDMTGATITVTTQTAADNSTKAASTAYVDAAIALNIRGTIHVVGDADYTVAAGVEFVNYSTTLTADRTITLPAASSNSGRHFHFLLQGPGGHSWIFSSSSNIILLGTSSSTTQTTNQTLVNIDMYSDGTTWITTGYSHS